VSDVAHTETSTGIDTRKVGMWAFLSSEALFFGALITNYLLFKGRDLQGIHPREVLNIPFTSVSSFVLLMSSLTMVLAHAALTRDDQPAARGWLLATAALGATFVGGQVFEFSSFYREGMTLTTNPASSSFFVLTGFHGAHVTVGIILLLTLVGISVRRRGLTFSHGLNLELVGLYWHFVDIVWIVIFTVVYLIR
jgi:heme/copper-type cytochrome/quinol oxidase subunit 3